MRTRRQRLAQERRGQARFAARRPEECAPHVIRMPGKTITTRGKRPSRRGGQAFDDQPDGLTPDVRINRAK
jgi:hypothetical protein